MEYKQIQELIKTINKSNISELSIEEGEFKITIKQEFTAGAPAMPAMAAQPAVQYTQAPQPAAQATAPSSAPAAEKAPTPAAASNLITIKSPMIGTFYR